MSSLRRGTEPIGAPARPSGMRRPATTCAALLLPLALVLAGCGSDPGDDDVASDPGSSSTPSETASANPSPTAAPTTGTYPAFEPEDYTYELTVGCFCAGAGVPIEVTVAGGVVTSAVYGDDGTGGGRSVVKPGQQVDKPFRLTIQDVIDAANDPATARVDVVWPDGQAYPTSVRIDQVAEAVDDEVGYELGDLVVR